MDRTILRRLRALDSEQILELLTIRQYLGPHKPVADVLTEVAAGMGLTLSSIRSAADRMELDVSQSVGRLKREQLEQLSRLTHRLYRQELTGSC